jgi:hypothetical protein
LLLGHGGLVPLVDLFSIGGGEGAVCPLVDGSQTVTRCLCGCDGRQPR